MVKLVSRLLTRCAAIAAATYSSLLPAQAIDDAAAWAMLKKPGAIVLFRHAVAPGGGDPAGLVLDDCSTQRNLAEEGRAQARRIGQRFRAQGIKVDAVLSSQWCRTRDTARLAFPELPTQDAPAFNSFFSDRSNEAAQTAAARKQLLAWRGTGVLVVVTHQVNITALTGISPASGEGVVLHRQGAALTVVARIAP
jgi:phosphohistidine phosphatase SixA